MGTELARQTTPWLINQKAAQLRQHTHNLQGHKQPGPSKPPPRAPRHVRGRGGAGGAGDALAQRTNSSSSLQLLLVVRVVLQQQ